MMPPRSRPEPALPDPPFDHDEVQPESSTVAVDDQDSGHRRSRRHESRVENEKEKEVKRRAAAELLSQLPRKQRWIYEAPDGKYTADATSLLKPITASEASQKPSSLAAETDFFEPDSDEPNARHAAHRAEQLSKGHVKKARGRVSAVQAAQSVDVDMPAFDLPTLSGVSTVVPKRNRSPEPAQTPLAHTADEQEPPKKRQRPLTAIRRNELATASRNRSEPLLAQRRVHALESLTTTVSDGRLAGSRSTLGLRTSSLPRKRQLSPIPQDRVVISSRVEAPLPAPVYEPEIDPDLGNSESDSADDASTQQTGSQRSVRSHSATPPPPSPPVQPSPDRRPSTSVSAPDSSLPAPRSAQAMLNGTAGPRWAGSVRDGRTPVPPATQRKEAKAERHRLLLDVRIRARRAIMKSQKVIATPLDLADTQHEEADCEQATSDKGGEDFSMALVKLRRSASADPTRAEHTQSSRPLVTDPSDNIVAPSDLDDEPLNGLHHPPSRRYKDMKFYPRVAADDDLHARLIAVDPTPTKKAGRHLYLHPSRKFETGIEDGEEILLETKNSLPRNRQPLHEPLPKQVATKRRGQLLQSFCNSAQQLSEIGPSIVVAAHMQLDGNSGIDIWSNPHVDLYLPGLAQELAQTMLEKTSVVRDELASAVETSRMARMRQTAFDNAVSRAAAEEHGDESWRLDE